MTSVRDTLFPATTRTVIVTGSRTWPDQRTLTEALDAEMGIALRANQILVVRYGKAWLGADLHTAAWCSLAIKRHGDKVREDPRPADWETHHKAAGAIRNAAMVHDGADKVIGFLMQCRLPECLAKRVHGTHGTTDCLVQAHRAGIMCEIYREARLPQIMMPAKRGKN